ncbi:CaiB/BaiF CoA-transferase family protein [Nocardioides sp. Arc9.136]|uniref:CaiB/BaiF CoA transferase family protein n=1 Tax=Nocardioides sp. Arc9.136 TaxID=2996826 RepID=UPI00266587E2|nr:CaiB/BaiF CoA-transferase family protein [Nocardioides sp. Arc9.136]WKN48650.1 CaiB/BaiF CoA-transferase family protein [Nocardioides sp. Arc9.136]
MSAPLAGLRVVELAGLGPTPHACMVLADLGADVVQVRRAAQAGPDGVTDADAGLWRGRRVVEADLKDPADLALVRDLVDRADVLVEGFRPGTTERLGLGPEECRRRNPRLVYARMTGWGQDGPLARAAGHDINYLATTGLLGLMGPADGPPAPPLSLVADFGGGSMLLVAGVLAALLERATSGDGQVVDAAMVDGANLLGQLQWSWLAAGRSTGDRASDLLNGSAPCYTTYTCADGRYVAVGALEEPFWRTLLELLDLDPAVVGDRWDATQWPRQRALLGGRFVTRTRDEWASVVDGTDACVTAVLDLSEAPAHPHARARAAYVEVDGHLQAAPAPRFSRSAPRTPVPPSVVGGEQVLASWS